MRAYNDTEWEFAGICRTGLVFKNIIYRDYSITQEAIYLRASAPKIYLKWTSEGVIFEHNRHPISSPSKFEELQLSEIFQTSQDVVSL